MTATTANRGYVYPQSTDDFRPYEDIQALAEDVDADVVTLLDNSSSPLPQGVIARGQRVTSTGFTSGGTELGVLRVDSIPVYSGRLYRIATGPIIVDGSVANDAVRVVLRGNTAGTATTASTQLAIAQTVIPNISLPETLQINIPYVPSANGTLSVLMSIVRQTGTGILQALGDATFPINLVVSDEGLDPGDTGVDI
jgi:hypothetical protein